MIQIMTKIIHKHVSIEVEGNLEHFMVADLVSTAELLPDARNRLDNYFEELEQACSSGMEMKEHLMSSIPYDVKKVSLDKYRP